MGFSSRFYRDRRAAGEKDSHATEVLHGSRWLSRTSYAVGVGGTISNPHAF